MTDQYVVREEFMLCESFHVCVDMRIFFVILSVVSGSPSTPNVWEMVAGDIGDSLKRRLGLPKVAPDDLIRIMKVVRGVMSGTPHLEDETRTIADEPEVIDDAVIPKKSLLTTWKDLIEVSDDDDHPASPPQAEETFPDESSGICSEFVAKILEKNPCLTSWFVFETMKAEYPHLRYSQNTVRTEVFFWRMEKEIEERVGILGGASEARKSPTKSRDDIEVILGGLMEEMGPLAGIRDLTIEAQVRLRRQNIYRRTNYIRSILLKKRAKLAKVLP